MISLVNGVVRSISPDKVIVEVGGVGLSTNITGTDVYYAGGGGGAGQTGGANSAGLGGGGGANTGGGGGSGPTAGGSGIVVIRYPQAT